MFTYERWIEQKIQEAKEEGAFEGMDDYRGKPIDNSDYFDAPPEDRLQFHLLKNHGFYPEEVQLRKDIQSLKERLEGCNTQEERKRLEKELADKENAYRLKIEQRKNGR